jgi:hypothetical protein
MKRTDEPIEALRVHGRCSHRLDADTAITAAFAADSDGNVALCQLAH